MVTPRISLCHILRWVVMFFIHFTHKTSSQTTTFDFPVLPIRNLTLLGDAHFRNGTVSLSRELGVPTSSAGRALYSQRVRFLDPFTMISASFRTCFSFSVTNVGPGPVPVSIGGGLAFIIASDDQTVGSSGGLLGVMTSSPTDMSGEAQQENQNTIAVEFDTCLDVEFHDPNGNHVGLDINNMTSIEVADLGTIDVDIKTGNIITTWIEYDSTEKLLTVSLSYSNLKPLHPVLSVSIDLSRYLKEFMYVGFSASTQGSTELHNIEGWSFSSFGPPSPKESSTSVNSPVYSPSGLISPLATDKKSPLPPPTPVLGLKGGCHGHVCMTGGLIVGLATGGAFVIAFLTGCIAWSCHRKYRGLKRQDSFSSDIVKLPRKFTYRELSIATKGFNVARIVGHGAFGTVYKGILPDDGALVAVKRSTNNSQGKNEFMAELKIIGLLRHRNLVHLQGWCYEKGEVLLVYDYMSNSSLDKVLFQEGGGPVLSWQHRCNIVMGVASALAYLHGEWEKQIVHRDVKASNIMLDGNFNARLGDFGLARLTEHNKSPDATLTAGTMGYLAPEYILSGKASDKTDVFSFGAVVLEVACGRRPIEKDDGRRQSNLVDWVWGLHRDGKLLEAADVRLEGNFDENEMRRMLLVGLHCSHPDPLTRSSMRQVMQILSGEAPVPHVPRSKPSLSFPNNLLMNLQDIVSDCDQSQMSSCSTSFKEQSSVRVLTP